MKKNKWIRILLLGLGAFVVLILAVIATIYIIIFMEVRKTCDIAIKEYKKDCVDSLILVLESEDKTFKEKNDAIWALGQITDVRALPALVAFQTENMPDREPLDKTISQYEIKKAIHWIEDGNWTSWMYFKYD